MRKKIITFVLIIGMEFVFAQTYNMKIKQGNGSTFSETSTLDEISFLNTTTTPYVCGDAILYGGETYPTIFLGGKCWFAKNLNIGLIITGTQTNNGTIERLCYSDVPANCITYGGLYQWDEAMQYSIVSGAKGICPVGWHIPTNSEYNALKSSNSDGNAFKSLVQGTGTGVGTNATGFSALLGGYHIQATGYEEIGAFGFFWTSDKSNLVAGASSSLQIYGSTGGIYTNFPFNPSSAISVRCVK